MKITDFLGKKLLFFDGAMGSLLQKRGLDSATLPETWNIERREEIVNIHLEYLNAGANILKTNTFGANRLKHGSEAKVREVTEAAIANAREAISKTESSGPHFVALDIGPTGKLLKPFGDLDFEDAVSIFAETVNAGKDFADCILIETMNDLYETKAAVIAAKENSDLPVFVTNAYDLSGKLMTGATPEAVCVTLEGLGVDAIGLNCSFGPREMLPVVKRLTDVCSVPVIVNPNAGLPTFSNGKTVYDIDEKEFAECMGELLKLGVHVAGGCCGTSPEYIKALFDSFKDYRITYPEEKNISAVSSYNHAVFFGKEPVIIGERINPTGKKLFKEALRRGDTDYILNVGLKQEEAGAHILDVNVGLPEIDEKEVMVSTVKALQGVTDLPLQIDTTDIDAMEAALRIYNGKAMINSVNGKKESMEKVFPLVKKYGGLVVALTLDENGIPSDAGERVEIARKIYECAEKYGISKKDIIVDTLAMAVSADSSSASCTLEALGRISRDGGLTSLGVSNISFGLPKREFINAAFFTMSLSAGLSAAIINPHSVEMMKAYKSYLALSGQDENFEEYISFVENVDVSELKESGGKKGDDSGEGLKGAIIKGLKENAYCSAKQLLEEKSPLEIINTEIIPALDTVGKGYEEKKIYLPQLLISAEAAKAAFDAVKEAVRSEDAGDTKKCPFVIATVKGDIHDIGKNIVKVLLENYGFDVIDLGKDVDARKVVEAVEKSGAPLVGLSALMTTTVPAMAETVKLLNEKFPNVRTVVGGAVMTEEYALAMGADKYASDAMETVRYAEAVNEEITKITFETPEIKKHL